MWGADPPTVKAITLRVAALKKLAKDGDVSCSPTKKTSRAGLVTPVTSPKSSVKRPRDEDKKGETTPRRRPKRGVRRVINYMESGLSSDEDDCWKEEAKANGSENESDERKNGMKEEDEEESRYSEDGKQDIEAEEEIRLASPFRSSAVAVAV